jgi:hypothetical protein
MHGVQVCTSDGVQSKIWTRHPCIVATLACPRCRHVGKIKTYVLVHRFIWRLQWTVVASKTAGRPKWICMKLARSMHRPEFHPFRKKRITRSHCAPKKKMSLRDAGECEPLSPCIVALHVNVAARLDWSRSHMWVHAIPLFLYEVICGLLPPICAIVLYLWGRWWQGEHEGNFKVCDPAIDRERRLWYQLLFHTKTRH